MVGMDGGNAETCIQDVLTLANREWRAIGVVEADRAALVHDLRMELTGAAEDGVAPRQLIADVRAFARNLAAEAGVRRTPYEFKRLLLTALSGTPAGVLLGWLVLYSPVPLYFEGPTLYTAYAAMVLSLLAGVLITVRWRMRAVPAIGRTVLGMAVLLPLAGAAITPLTMGFAAVLGYSTFLPVVVIEVGMVAGALAGATVLARRWALAPMLGPAEPAAPEPPTAPRGPGAGRPGEAWPGGASPAAGRP